MAHRNLHVFLNLGNKEILGLAQNFNTGNSVLKGSDLSGSPESLVEHSPAQEGGNSDTAQKNYPVSKVSNKMFCFPLF